MKLEFSAQIKNEQKSGLLWNLHAVSLFLLILNLCCFPRANASAHLLWRHAHLRFDMATSNGADDLDVRIVAAFLRPLP